MQIWIYKQKGLNKSSAETLSISLLGWNAAVDQLTVDNNRCGFMVGGICGSRWVLGEAAARYPAGQQTGKSVAPLGSQSCFRTTVNGHSSLKVFFRILELYCRTTVNGRSGTRSMIECSVLL